MLSEGGGVVGEVQKFFRDHEYSEANKLHKLKYTDTFLETYNLMGQYTDCVPWCISRNLSILELYFIIHLFNHSTDTHQLFTGPGITPEP